MGADVAGDPTEAHDVSDEDDMPVEVDDDEEDEQERAEATDMQEWKAISREQLLAGMTAMLPSLVDTSWR